MPCADAAMQNEETHQTIDNHHTEHTTDHCSPLCVCNCCGTITIYQETIKLQENIQFQVIKEEDGFMLPSIPKVYYAIWQPPQLF